MNHEILFAPHAGRRLRAGVVGAGEFGASFIYRSARAQGLAVEAVADSDTARAVAAAQRAGVARERIRVCTNRAAALDAHARGEFVVVEDVSLLVPLPLDFVVEATGDPEAAARSALAALGEGRHVAMVTKEADCVAGPMLQAKANAAGLVYTPVDGDQPSLMIALVSWARMLGLEVVCAGKSGEYDVVLDAAAGTVTSTATGEALQRPEFAALWSVPAARLASCITARAQQLAQLPRATVPDTCELAIVANATGLAPDTPALHAPIARTLELPELFRPQAAGGLLSGEGRVDMFVCLRRPDELSFAGGVFVVVRCDDAATWRVLKGKGIPVSEDGGTALLHNPVHLLGIEAPMSLFNAGLLHAPAAALLPRCDLVARAARALAAGSTLTIGMRHAVDGLRPEIVDAAPLADDAPLPYYLAAGCRLRRDVPAGAAITAAMVEAPADSALWRLRAEQDAHFFGRAR
jgi:predicted homoserine dehydrogenase-like protein